MSCVIIIPYRLRFFFLRLCAPAIYLWLYVVCVHYVVMYICNGAVSIIGPVAVDSAHKK
jgi:hypothetical protein